MREIIFRGKRIDNREWVEGWYYQKPNPCSEDGKPVRHAILDLPPFGYDINPETIGQYTGLRDRNGKRIFEGDILEAHLDDLFPEDSTVVQVIWYESGWKIKQHLHHMYFAIDDLDSDYLNRWAVIGNVYDNPELWEGGDCGG